MGASSGGSQKVSTAPWKGLQPYLNNLYSSGQDIVNNPPQYYPGQTYTDLNQYQQGGLQGAANYATGGLQNFADQSLGTNSQLMSGNTALGGFGNMLGGATANQFGNLYNTPYSRSAQSFYQPQQNLLNGSNPASGAYAQMLSGQPNTQGFEGALNAAYAPMMQQWQNSVLPGIQQTDYAAGGGQGSSGAGKLALLANQQMANSMANTAGGLGYNAYQNAQQNQATAVGLGGQLGQSYDTLGQQQSMQNAANRQQTGLANQQAGLATQGNILQGANVAGNLLGQNAQQQLGSLALAPQTGAFGLAPSQALSNVGQAYNSQDNLALQDQMNRYNFGQQQPMNMASWFSQLLQPSMAYNTQSTSGGGSPILGGLGGALAGQQLGAGIGTAGNNYGGLGSILGGLAGIFG